MKPKSCDTENTSCPLLHVSPASGSELGLKGSLTPVIHLPNTTLPSFRPATETKNSTQERPNSLLSPQCGKQRWAWIRTGSDWIRTEANFGWIRTGSDCNFFENWRIRTGSDWESFLCFYVIILNISKLLVVIRFHRFAKWQCIFCHQWQKLCWDILQFELLPPLSTYKVEF